MRAWVLGSGSGGNAVLLEGPRSRVLVDAGFPPRTLAARLALLGVRPESIDALVITHEHRDHACGAAAAAARWRFPLLGTRGTLGAMGLAGSTGTIVLEPGRDAEAGDFALRTVGVPHDAAEPVAVIAEERSSGCRAAVAYDLGRATRALHAALRGVELVVLEFNHDEDMLQAGPYPPSVRARIAGPLGHLSNRAAAALAAECAGSGLETLVLAHVSRRCNTPERALASARRALRGSRCRGDIRCAAQDRPCGPLAAPGSRGQLVLGI